MYKFFTDAFYNIIRQVLNLILGMMVLILIARELGPGGQGSYSLIILLPGLLTTLFNFGIGVSAAYFIGKQRYPLNTIYKTNMVLASVVSLIIVISGATAIIMFKDVFFEQISIEYLFVSLLAVPLLIFLQYTQVIFQGLQDFKPYNLILILGKLTNLIALIFLLQGFIEGIIGAVVAYILGELASVVTAQYILKKKYSSLIKKGKLSREYTKEVFLFGMKTHLTNIMAYVNNRVDIFLISYFLNPTYLGLYSVSINISEKLSIVTNSISTVLFPKISSLEDEKERNNLTSIVTRLMLGISILGATILFICAGLIINLLFGESYLLAVPTFRILLVGIIFATVSRLIANDISGRGFPELNLYVSIVLVILNVLLNVILIPKYNIIGAALSTSIVSIINFMFKILIFRFKFQVPFQQFLLVNKNDFNRLYLLVKKVLHKGLKK